MKKIFLLLILFAFTASLQAQDVKIGYTSAYLILPHVPAYMKAQDSLKKTEAALTNQLMIKQNDFEAKYKKFEADRQSGDVIPVLLRTRANDLQKLQQEITQERELYSQELQKMQAALQTPILQKVKTAIEEVGKENGYTFILSSQDGMGQDNFLFSTDKIDITLLVLDKLGVKMTPEQLAAANAKLEADAIAAEKAAQN
ncbi:outer membrane protein [Bernardetia litoralis DSM 6794]|uniref:Outer membrane protein n=1 Tax=Bernardetia litoralis (strain ATCC 23117 / DSM 6794 / NBRC 15988 / NCIMB 1366 / Fx l1 / Sio-4) TaxID=880071 RepID=I4AJ31_BERLS|nr:OmpH family outer membrane protein [Bernardetia litoralis]AFM03966.1 outer membrane protein [Bernardetia litoralis DSM 6794]